MRRQSSAALLEYHLHIHLLLGLECRAQMHIHLLLCWECRAQMHIHLLLCWQCRAHTHIHLLLYWERRALMHTCLLIRGVVLDLPPYWFSSRALCFQPCPRLRPRRGRPHDQRSCAALRAAFVRQHGWRRRLRRSPSHLTTTRSFVLPWVYCLKR